VKVEVGNACGIGSEEYAITVISNCENPVTASPATGTTTKINTFTGKSETLNASVTTWSDGIAHPISYQWYYSADANFNPATDTPLTGKTQNSFPVVNEVPGTYYYYCEMGNNTCASQKILSGAYQVVVACAVPTSVTPSTGGITNAYRGEGVSMTLPADVREGVLIQEVSANFSGPVSPTYQWYRNTTGRVSASDPVAPGTSNQNTYTIPASDTSPYGSIAYYYCVISNPNVNCPNTKATTGMYKVKVTCGAYIAQDRFREFQCYNVGVTDKQKPFTPHQRLNGSYYQWGNNTKTFTLTGTIAAALWNTDVTYPGKWVDNSSTSNVEWVAATSICPSGYRLPTNAEWTAVISNTTWNPLESDLPGTVWSTGANDGAANYKAGVLLGKALYLPAAGRRAYKSGLLTDRGIGGYYWSSTPYSSGTYSFAYLLYLNDYRADMTTYSRPFGYSIRCIANN
jgi:uncharacterized protein (TIGR02145 family)